MIIQRIYYFLPVVLSKPRCAGGVRGLEKMAKIFKKNLR